MADPLRSPLSKRQRVDLLAVLLVTVGLVAGLCFAWALDGWTAAGLYLSVVAVLSGALLGLDS